MGRMRIPFPTGSVGVGGTPEFGVPDQARPCRGHRQLLHDDTCFWCGRLPEPVIVQTWEARAQVVTRAERPAPFRRMAALEAACAR